MPRDYGNSMEGMDANLYGEERPGKKGSVDEQNEENATDLMSKSSFPGGCKVGDKYEIEITGDHGDQFSVKVMPEGEMHEAGSRSEDDDMGRLNKEY